VPTKEGGNGTGAKKTENPTKKEPGIFFKIQ
jgi:hypothetical protein